MCAHLCHPAPALTHPLQVYSECPSYDELVPALLAHPIDDLAQVGLAGERREGRAAGRQCWMGVRPGTQRAPPAGTRVHPVGAAAASTDGLPPAPPPSPHRSTCTSSRVCPSSPCWPSPPRVGGWVGGGVPGLACTLAGRAQRSCARAGTRPLARWHSFTPTCCPPSQPTAAHAGVGEVLDASRHPLSRLGFNPSLCCPSLAARRGRGAGQVTAPSRPSAGRSVAPSYPLRRHAPTLSSTLQAWARCWTSSRTRSSPASTSE